VSHDHRTRGYYIYTNQLSSEVFMPSEFVPRGIDKGTWLKFDTDLLVLKRLGLKNNHFNSAKGGAMSFADARRWQNGPSLSKRSEIVFA
jgi:hypothetical protein